MTSQGSSISASQEEIVYNVDTSITKDSSDINTLIWSKVIQDVPHKNVGNRCDGALRVGGVIARTSHSIVRGDEMDFAVRVLEPEPATWHNGYDIFFVIYTLKIWDLIIAFNEGSVHLANWVITDLGIEVGSKGWVSDTRCPVGNSFDVNARWEIEDHMKGGQLRKSSTE